MSAADSRHLVSGSMDETVAFWDLSNGQKVKRFNNRSSPLAGVACFIPRTGPHFRDGNHGETTRVWNTFTSAELKMLKFHTKAVWKVAYSPHGHHIVSGSENMTIGTSNGVNWRPAESP
ncbi:hypothetical protein WAI453_008456 [Rhynchosporium graminicola]